MLVRGHFHWCGDKCQLVRPTVKAPLLSHGHTYIGNEGWKVDYQLLTLVKVPVSCARKTDVGGNKV